MERFDPSRFSSGRISTPTISFWGGGFTPQTDPCARGWRCKPVRGKDDLWVVGRPGRDGCMSIKRLPDGRLQVAFYLSQAPKEVADNFEKGQRTHVDFYRDFDDYSGVFLAMEEALNESLHK